MATNKSHKAPHSERDRNKAASKLKKDPGVPKLISLKKKETAATNAHKTNAAKKHGKAPERKDVLMVPVPLAQTIASLAANAAALASNEDTTTSASSSRDNTISAYARHFRKVVELSDVIVQVLDARDPLGTRSRILEDEVLKAGAGVKKMVLVLNKIDLIPKDNVVAWLKYLRHTHPTIPLSSSSGSSPKHLLTLLKRYRPSHHTLTIGVVGAPNVGKSSLINALFRMRASSSNEAPCVVGAKPGQTKEVKEVAVEKGLKILDSPGIVWGDFMSGTGEEGSISVGSLNMIGIDAMEDPVAAVESLVLRVSPETLQTLYRIPPFKDVTEMLVMIALSRGRLGKGGKPDIDAAARTVLHDWNSGVIPYHTVPPVVHPSSVPNVVSLPPPVVPEEGSDALMTSAQDVGQAKILNKFSEPFDLEGLWSVVDRDVLGEGGQDMEDVNDEGFVDPGAMDEDGNPMESDDLNPIIPAKRSRSESPLPDLNQALPGPDFSFDSTPGDSILEGKQKHKKPRVRYNPMEPIEKSIDAHERGTMASSGALGRKKLREERRRKRRGRGIGVGEVGMVIDDVPDSDTTVPTAESLMAAFSVPLPESDDEDL